MLNNVFEICTLNILGLFILVADIPVHRIEDNELLDEFCIELRQSVKLLVLLFIVFVVLGLLLER